MKFEKSQLTTKLQRKVLENRTVETAWAEF